MRDLEGRWIGSIFGTYAGNAFAEIGHENEALVVTFRANINEHAIVLIGPLVETQHGINAELSSTEDPIIRVTFTFQRSGDNHLHGTWIMDGGHAGVFRLERPVFEASHAPKPNNTEPIQVIQRTGQIPKITIYKEEIHTLVRAMQELMPSPYDVVILANSDGKDIKRLAANFWDSATLPDRAEFLNLNLTEPVEGIQRNINIVLGPSECSFSISGANTVWVDGAYHQVDSLLRRHHSFLRKIYEKHALNINGLLFLIVLVLLPSLDLPSRAFLLTTMIAVILSFKWLHTKTTALRIFLRAERRETRLINLTELITLLLGTAILAAVPFAYQWLRGDGLRRLFEALAALS